MLLKYNVIVPDEEKEVSLLVQEPPPEVIGAGAALGIVYVVNATPKSISSITVGPVSLPTVPGESPLGQPPHLVPVNRYGSPPVFNGGAHVTVNFESGRSYEADISIRADRDQSLTLWCFYDGMVLTDADGGIRQICWGLVKSFKLGQSVTLQIVRNDPDEPANTDEDGSNK